VKVCPFCGSRFEAEDWLCPACGRQPPGNSIPVFAPALEKFSEHFEERVFLDLASLEVEHPWFTVRNDIILWAIARYFPNARSLLEVGCGVGTVLAAVRQARPEMSLTGADAFPPCLEIAKRRLERVDLLQLDARRLPFDREFDLVCLLDVLEHLDEDQTALEEAFRALRPGGGLIVAVPQHRWLWSAADDYALHRRRYRSADLLSKLHAADFEVVHRTSFVTSLLPVLLISRLLQRRLDKYDPRNELSERRSLRFLLKAGMSADRAVVERGIRLPVGGSLLVVSRRPS
jgi:SAM-dependent methyltransferase